MAITITIAELLTAMRLTESPEELAQATRLHALASEITTTTAPSAPEVVANECVVRLASYLYDMPTASPGDGYANAWRSSGAGRLALPYQIHRAGLTGGEAVAVAQGAVGSVGNPVVGIDLTGDVLTVTFADGTTETHTLPAGGGVGGVDQDARDSAAAAQGTADGAQTEIDAHESSEHNTDSTARTAAATAQSEIDAHAASTHNTDITAQSTALNARQTAEQAQTTIETHERATHNTDSTARTAAAAAQTTANTARTELTAHEGTPHGGGGGAGVDQTARDAAAAAQGEIDAHEVTTHNTDTTARSTARNARQTAEQAQTGLEAHEASTHNTDAGARTAAANAQSAVEDHERTTHNTDQTARDAAAAAQTAAEAAAGGRPTVLFEAATAAIGGSTGLITGNVVCPETGILDCYFRQVTGDRQGSIAYARIPAADLRTAVSALSVGYNNDNENVRIIALGANRGVSLAVQATTFYIMLNAQSSGNFYTLITHIE